MPRDVLARCRIVDECELAAFLLDTSRHRHVREHPGSDFISRCCPWVWRIKMLFLNYFRRLVKVRWVSERSHIISELSQCASVPFFFTLYRMFAETLRSRIQLFVITELQSALITANRQNHYKFNGKILCQVLVSSIFSVFPSNCGTCGRYNKASVLTGCQNQELAALISIDFYQF